MSRADVLDDTNCTAHLVQTCLQCTPQEHLSYFSSWSTVTEWGNRHSRTSSRSQSTVVCPRVPIAAPQHRSSQQQSTTPNQRAHSCGILDSWIYTTQSRPVRPRLVPARTLLCGSQPVTAIAVSLTRAVVSLIFLLKLLSKLYMYSCPTTRLSQGLLSNRFPCG